MMVSVIEQAEAITGRYHALWRRLTSAIAERMPKGLYARALIIIIAPIVLLQTLLAFVFMEQHWDTVTRRLSTATTRDIAMLLDVYESYTRKDEYQRLIRMARNSLGLTVQIMPAGELPAPRPKPFFALLDRALSNEFRKRIDKPFWIDTVGRGRYVDIRIKMPNSIFRVLARRSQTYASNSHIFLVWMVGTSLVLLTVAILFLRNQIKPILRLGEAAETFGKGRPVPDDFRPRGAREVRQAAQAFVEMRDRIERHVDQRTTMLAGVSHDLRTILTRFKLQLAMFDDSPEAQAMYSDANEMQHMLEDYLAFAKGDSGEETLLVNIRNLLYELSQDASRFGKSIVINAPADDVEVPMRRHAFKRALSNLVSNAVRYADHIVVSARVNQEWLMIDVEDDGPGIPAEEREQVFRPFYRVDTARNQDVGNTGLGLSIARDIAHGHGGDIYLSKSSLGGLKAVVKIPL